MSSLGKRKLLPDRKACAKKLKMSATKSDEGVKRTGSRLRSRPVPVSYIQGSSEEESKELSSADEFEDPDWRNYEDGKKRKKKNMSQSESSSEEFESETGPRRRKSVITAPPSLLPENQNGVKKWEDLSEPSSSDSDGRQKESPKKPKKVVNSVNFTIKCVKLAKIIKEIEIDRPSSAASQRATNSLDVPVCNMPPQKNRKKTKRSLTMDVRRSTRKHLKIVASPKGEKIRGKVKESGQGSSDDDESDCWEEVKDGNEIESYDPRIPEEGVDIMLELPTELQKKGKGQKKSRRQLFLEYCQFLRRKMIKVNHFNAHKCHLLCLISYTFHVTDFCSSPLVDALILSILPKHILYMSTKSFGIIKIRTLVQWFRAEFKVSVAPSDDTGPLSALFIRSFELRRGSPRILAFMFAAVLWFLRINCRIVFSLNPIPIKDYKDAKNPFLKNNWTTEDGLSLFAKGRSDHHHEYVVKSSVKNSVKEVSTKRRSASKTIVKEESSSDLDSDFAPEPMKRQAKNDGNGRVSAKKRKLEHSNVEGDGKHSPIDQWLEIYAKEGWICVDCINGSIDSEDAMEANCTGMQLSYVLAVEKGRKLKDVTERYASGWLNKTQKLRLDWHCGPNWWADTLEPHLIKGKKVKDENRQLEEKSMNLPLPKSISEYKHHKLYALARHLLKYQAIYPPDAPSLGFIKNETIYARECIRTLYSRDHWMQRARTVCLGQTPYKVVKARPGFRKSENDKDRMLELFGEWQTEKYDPPAAIDGKIPRNAYGNVELFKPEMIPKGTKHLTEMPGLIRIARKLNVDCAQAMVGWDFRKGRNVPMMDGWVVCNEHVDILKDAWREEQVNIAKREQEKRLKRIYGNWRKLIRGLLIKKKIESRYGDKTS